MITRPAPSRGRLRRERQPFRTAGCPVVHYVVDTLPYPSGDRRRSGIADVQERPDPALSSMIGTRRFLIRSTRTSEAPVEGAVSEYDPLDRRRRDRDES